MSDDLPRLVSPESDASARVRDVLGTALDDDPSPRELDQLTQRLAAALPPGTFPSGGGGGGGGGAGGAAIAKGAAVAVVIAAGAGIWVATTKPPAPPPPRPEVAPAACVAVVESAAPLPVLAVSDLPVASDTVKPPPPRPSAAPAESESQLLTRAQEALASGSPAKALAITDEHRRVYPSGVLAEERERIAIEALVKSGDVPKARARADAFATAFPRSAYRARIDALVGP
jgi:hypothetical protein